MDLRKAARDPWVWGQLVLVLLVAFGAPVLPRYVNLGNPDFMLNRVDPTWIRTLSAIPIFMGLALLFRSARTLGRNLTPGTEPLSEGKLVTGGPYDQRRHPMYAGAVLLLGGYTLAWSNWTMALLVGLVAWLFFDGKARAEERWLLQRFPEYRAYSRRVLRRVF
jgi:protein-S-isoprenylcysteine O-methyltransferase Ste14